MSECDMLSFSYNNSVSVTPRNLLQNINLPDLKTGLVIFGFSSGLKINLLYRALSKPLRDPGAAFDLQIGGNDTLCSQHPSARDECEKLMINGCKYQGVSHT